MSDREDASAPLEPPASRAGNPPPLHDGRADFGLIFIHATLDEYGLTASEFRVYAHLARRAGRQVAFPAVSTMAHVCMLHAQTVRKALRTLLRLGLIARQERPGRTPLYSLTPATCWRPRGARQAGTAPTNPIEAPPVSDSEGYPYESDRAEVTPPEVTPLKKGRGALRPLPSSEAEALAVARAEQVPDDLALDAFHRLMSVGWRDGAGRPIKDWAAYLRARLRAEQRRGTPRTARSEVRAPGRNPCEIEAADKCLREVRRQRRDLDLRSQDDPAVAFEPAFRAERHRLCAEEGRLAAFLTGGPCPKPEP